MRFFSLFLSLLLLSAALEAQQKRYLVSPNDEVIPLTKGQSARQAMQERMRKTESAKQSASANKAAAACPTTFHFGYAPPEHGGNYTSRNGFTARHRDVIGEWFVVPATGTIDTLYWMAGTAVGAFDSTVFVRIHRSNIGPDYGPGVRPGPYKPPCQNWGFWPNTDDADQGVSSFVEESTGPWTSTINGSPVPAGVPFGTEIWGSGGYPVVLKPAKDPNNVDTMNYLDMSLLGSKPHPTKGDKIFISFRANYDPSLPNGGHVDPATEISTLFRYDYFNVTTNDPDYPARNWKFYEHDKGPSQCAGFPIDSIRRGWVARGGNSNTDTLNVGAFLIWYSMTVTSNVPPTVDRMDALENTLSTGSRLVTATITDCNPANPGNAGVQGAIIRYAVDGAFKPDIIMVQGGGDEWEGTIPGYPAYSTISYKVIATDLDGAIGQGAAVSYRVIKLSNSWYTVDTLTSCTQTSIALTGTSIDSAAWFEPHYTGSATAPRDDGTAGPFALGFPFVYFGEQYNYAWVGVDGAISLTKTATDTNDVNLNGFAANIDLPFPVHLGRTDTAGRSNLPRAFIAPLWADWIVEQDSPNIKFGKILHGNGGDVNKFIVEWNNIGRFNAVGSVASPNTFRVILDKPTGVVTFEYATIIDTQVVSQCIGLQKEDTTGAWVFVNGDAGPTSTRPRSGMCYKFTPTVGAYALDSWNMLSVSATPNDGNYLKTHLFPSAVSPAYAYGSGYAQKDTLKMGAGYWMKFNAKGNGGGGVTGTFVNSMSVPLQNKWNMIGGVSTFVPTSSGITPTDATVTSQYYSYSGAYSGVTTLVPGQGYWVKVNVTGPSPALALTGTTAAPKEIAVNLDAMLAGMSKFTIQDNAEQKQSLYLGSEGQLKQDVSLFELPPAPPEGAFDARFSSDRQVETYPAAFEKGKTYEYAINIQTHAAPSVVRYDMGKSGGKVSATYYLNGKMVQRELKGSGKLNLGDAKTLVLRVGDGTAVPKTFALSQNYPNPFNPTTHFTVDVPRASQVDVAVFDVLGRKVATILSGAIQAGSYNLEWNGRDNQGMSAPTGMYIVRMSSDDFSAVRKIMLLK